MTVWTLHVVTTTSFVDWHVTTGAGFAVFSNLGFIFLNLCMVFADVLVTSRGCMRVAVEKAKDVTTDTLHLRRVGVSRKLVATFMTFAQLRVCLAFSELEVLIPHRQVSLQNRKDVLVLQRCVAYFHVLRTSLIGPRLAGQISEALQISSSIGDFVA
jgi:hypothetical protein